MSDAAAAPILEIGRIGRAHGLRGEVAVTFLTERPERTEPGAHLTARSERVTRDLVVAGARRHQQRWLVRFEGVDDRDAASALTGMTLYASALPSAGDDLWVHEVVGATVVDRHGTVLGEVASVEANPAHDLLVLEGGALVPVTFVVDHDRDDDGSRRVVVEIPDGLLEL